MLAWGQETQAQIPQGNIVIGLDLVADGLTAPVYATHATRSTGSPILRPHLREVLVQGGKFFPERTRACLSGSSFGGSCLKLGWVDIGLHLEFHAGGQWIITSHVRAIAVEASPTGAPC